MSIATKMNLTKIEINQEKKRQLVTKKASQAVATLLGGHKKSDTTKALFFDL